LILGFRRPQQQRDVLACGTFQPRCDPRVDVVPPFVRQLGIDGGSDEVVDDAERASLLHEQACRHQLRSCRPRPILRPASDGDEVFDRRLASEQGDRFEEHRGVSARGRETVGNDARDIGVDISGFC